ncbi:MAG TPA: FHA domain-containing protein, partial [Vicinamibacterales bacterium]|nr:FHA domain-containing protein [Vicinamibacterales bacterium]
MSLTLLVDDGALPRELVLVGTTLVGRDPECEISHADPRLSRRHAEFRVTSDGVRLRDLGSRNGTLVNGRRVDEIVLTPGDIVQIAHLTIRFNDAGADPTVHMIIGPRSAVPPVQDDRTRVVSPAEAAIARAPTAVGLPMPLDDRTRLKLAAPVQAPRTPPSAVRPALAFSPSSSALRAARPTEAIQVGPIGDAGEVVIHERPGPAAAPGPPADLSVFGLAGTGWGRQVLLQGLALAVLVLLLTAAPLLAWELRLYGNSILSS